MLPSVPLLRREQRVLELSHLWGHGESNGLRVRELRICSDATEVDGVGARRGGFGIEPAAAVNDESQAAYCDQNEKKVERAAAPTCRKERKQAGRKKSIGDGVRGSGRLIASVAVDVVGVDGDLRCGCSAGQEL